MHDFDWFVDRLDVAKWENANAGNRSAFFNCPVHGGSDSLHISEKNSAALVHCFGCDVGYQEVVDALEGEESEEETTPVRIKRARVEDPQEQPGAAGEDTGSSTLPRVHQSPLAWMAARCGISLKTLKDLNLPLSESADMVIFDFPNARKLRGTGEGKKNKDFRWSGETAPPLWPMPEEPGREIVVCEGESDAICLRASGLEAYSITKGANSEIPAVIWEALYGAGARLVRIVYDLDDAGRKGRDLAVEGARAAGLDARPSKVAGIQPLLGEKDPRAVALRLGYPLELEDDSNEDDATVLSEVTAATPGLSLLRGLGAEKNSPGFLHPLEHTILYGDGGTGKGVIAAWMVARLTRLKPRHMRVLIVDYEQHAQYEWRPRVERFGGDMSQVLIVQPIHPIWEIAGWLKGLIERYEIDYVVIDSVSYACVGQEVEASTTAVQYSMAVATLQKPALSIAHVTKNDLDPKHPFGSIMWSNGARLTIAVSINGEDPDSPRVMRNSKTNQHAPFPMVAVDWRWVIDQLPTDLSFRPAFKSARAAAQAFIRENGRPPTPEELEEYSGYSSNENAISQAAHGMKGSTSAPRIRRKKKVDTDDKSV